MKRSESSEQKVSDIASADTAFPLLPKLAHKRACVKSGSD